MGPGEPYLALGSELIRPLLSSHLASESRAWVPLCRLPRTAVHVSADVDLVRREGHPFRIDELSTCTVKPSADARRIQQRLPFDAEPVVQLQASPDADTPTVETSEEPTAGKT